MVSLSRFVSFPPCFLWKKEAQLHILRRRERNEQVDGRNVCLAQHCSFLFPVETCSSPSLLQLSNTLEFIPTKNQHYTLGVVRIFLLDISMYRLNLLLLKKKKKTWKLFRSGWQLTLDVTGIVNFWYGQQLCRSSVILFPLIKKKVVSRLYLLHLLEPWKTKQSKRTIRNSTAFGDGLTGRGLDYRLRCHLCVVYSVVGPPVWYTCDV